MSCLISFIDLCKYMLNQNVKTNKVGTGDRKDVKRSKSSDGIILQVLINI